MLEFAAITYGFVTNFVLFSIQRNNKEKRPNPPILVHVGYVMVGMSAGASALLAGAAVRALAG